MKKFMSQIAPVLIVGATLIISGVILYRTFGSKSMRARRAKLHDKKRKDIKATKLNFVPADFEVGLDEEQVIRILKDPEKYPRQFDHLVQLINRRVLRHVANRLDLPDELRKEVELEYNKHHAYLKKQYLREFLQLKKPDSKLYNIWYKNQASASVKLFKEVSSKYACYLADMVFSTIAERGGFKILQDKKNMETPCGVALKEAIGPMMERLEQQAALADFKESGEVLKKKVEKNIAELAVMEVQDKKVIDKTVTAKLFGFDVSSTDVTISAISNLKVGFDLQSHFSIQIKPRNKEIVVSLPEPTILSHEVYPRVDKLDLGWMRALRKEDLNQYMNSLREAFRRDAYNSHIFDKSKKQVEELLRMIIGPVAKSISPKYKIRFEYVKIDHELAKFQPRPTKKVAGLMR